MRLWQKSIMERSASWLATLLFLTTYCDATFEQNLQQHHGSGSLTTPSGFFSLEFTLAGLKIEIRTAALSEISAQELSEGHKMNGFIEVTGNMGEELCEWLQRSLTLRAPPPDECIDNCRCEDDAELLDMQLSMRSKGEGSNSGPHSCMDLADVGIGCSGDLAKYCARSCGLCRKGYIPQLGRKKIPLPSDRCADRNRPAWAVFDESGSRLPFSRGALPWLSQQLESVAADSVKTRRRFYLLELGVWRWPPSWPGGELPLRPFTAVSAIPAVFAASVPVLTQEECEAIIELASKRLQPSVVEAYGAEGGPGATSAKSIHASRTSSVAWLNPVDDGPAVQRVFQVGARLLREENPNRLEQLQVIRYEPGQFYHQHTDYFEYWKYPPRSDAQRAIFKRTKKGQANRVATILFYLSDCPGSGGETNFPYATPLAPKPEPMASQTSAVFWGSDAAGPPADFSECSVRGASVRAKQGWGVLFYHMHANGTLDPRAMHAGCPPEEVAIRGDEEVGRAPADVEDGGRRGCVKWAANLWHWNAEVSDWPTSVLKEGSLPLSEVPAADDKDSMEL